MAALLAGKSTIVTGGVTGIGRAIALEYLRNGATVTVNHLGDARSEKHWESLQKEAAADDRLIAVAGDIGKQKTGRKIVDMATGKFGGVDAMVACAGVSQFRDFLT